MVWQAAVSSPLHRPKAAACPPTRLLLVALVVLTMARVVAMVGMAQVEVEMA